MYSTRFEAKRSASPNLDSAANFGTICCPSLGDNFCSVNREHKVIWRQTPIMEPLNYNKVHGGSSDSESYRSDRQFSPSKSSFSNRFAFFSQYYLRCVLRLKMAGGELRRSYTQMDFSLNRVNIRPQLPHLFHQQQPLHQQQVSASTVITMLMRLICKMTCFLT